MFKKVRSLLVAGLLVVGMTGAAFADSNCILNITAGSHNEETKTHTIAETDNVKLEDFDNYVTEVNAKSGTTGYILVAVEGKGAGETEQEWKLHMDYNLDGKIEDFTIGEAEYKETEVKETIVFNAADNRLDQKGVLPELPITPGTGDTLALGGLVIAAGAAGVALLVNNKKIK